MSILYNGGSDPKQVTYNGTELSKVVCDGVIVWPHFAQSVPLITVSLSGSGKSGGTVYLRDLKLTDASFQHNSRINVWTGWYACEYSANLSWPQYEQVGYAGNSVSWTPSTCQTPAFSGLPSDWGGGVLNFNADNKANLDFKNGRVPASAPTVTGDMAMTFWRDLSSSMGIGYTFIGNVGVSSSDVVDLTIAHSGLVVQGTGVLSVERSESR